MMYEKIGSLFLLLMPALLFSQSFWRKVSETGLNIDRSQREIIPEKYETFQLNTDKLKNHLSNAGEEFSLLRTNDPLLIEIPLPDGSFEMFAIVETMSMESELAKKFPAIKTYKGISKSDPSRIIRFDLGPNGFHGAIKTYNSFIYIDPYSLQNDQYYMSYHTKDHFSKSYTGVQFCGTDHSDLRPEKSYHFGFRSANAEKIELRVYRMAMACTAEWGSRRGTVEKALADMVSMVNRVNLIYENELAVRMILVNNNDKLIFLDPTTQPYENTNQGRIIINQNTSIINTRIGSANYEIGHVLSVCNDVGGIASLGSLCSNGKGAGVTCHNNSNIESIVVRVLAHEMGHQMAASHTFNSCLSTDQLSLGTAFEPGSGSTIMSYAGSCGSDNLTNITDDYYHVASLEQMLGFTNLLSSDAYNCAQKIDINNHLPIVNIPLSKGFTIPKSTPFELTGEAFDEDGDPLTYIWEQFDNGASNPLGSPAGDCPLFRTLKPSTNPTRFFPNATRILSNRFSDNEEFLPNYTRNLNFRFVVRDNNPDGGATVWEDLKFKVTDQSGPFSMIYPNVTESFKVGQKVKVQWDVAGTDLLPVNCKNVDIYLSFDGELRSGHSDLILLDRQTPNDGEAEIIIPNRISNRVRFVIKASDNIFLTTSLTDSRIVTPTVPSFFMDVDNNTQSVCLPDQVDYHFSTFGFGGLNDSIRFEVVSGLPVGAEVQFVPKATIPGQSVSMMMNMSDVIGTQDYRIIVRALVKDLDTIERVLNLSVNSTDLNGLTGISPANGLENVSATQLYNWTEKEFAQGYLLEVSTNPDFSPQNILISQDLKSTSYLSPLIMEKTSLFYWRVKSYNQCKEGEWSDINVFGTQAYACFEAFSGELSLNISASSTPVVEATLNVFTEGIVDNVVVKNLRGEHQRVGDLVTFLVAPSGKEVMLWSRKCGTSKGFSVTLDDQANDFFQCPINISRTYRPETPLSQLSGELVKGGWKVRIEDRAPGEGGRLQEFNLEFCSNINVVPPRVIVNNPLKLRPQEKKIIDNEYLEVVDDNNLANELIYTLVKIPENGTLFLNEIPLIPGKIFTQQDVNNGKLQYLHNENNAEQDYFSFTVKDDAGGWISITRFEIKIDPSIPSSTNESNDTDKSVSIYPNPADQFIHIRLSDSPNSFFNVEISDVNGKIFKRTELQTSVTAIDISALTAGIYFAKISDNTQSFTKRFIKF